jgi:hypothetical protein
MPQAKQTTTQRLSEAASGLDDLGKAIDTLFGGSPTAAAPTSYTPATNIAGPPPPIGGAANTAGAQSGGLPPVQAPAPRAPLPSPGALQTGTEFNTGAGARGAVVASGLGNVFGAMSNIENNKRNDNIQHAQFLYNLLNQAYSSGDEQTANFILGDNKNRKLIEKYLTGALPRVPTNPATAQTPISAEQQGPVANALGGTQTMPQAPNTGQINEPGGVALPRPGAEQQLAAARANALLEGFKKGDPRAVGQVMGPQAALSPEDYQRAIRTQFGIDLSAAQVATLDANTRDSLIAAKADVMKYVVGKQATLDSAMAVAKIHAGATVDAAKVSANARLEIAKNYREFLLKIKNSAPDKIDQETYSGLMKLYTNMATTSQTKAEDLTKAGQKQLAQQYLNEAKDYVTKAEQMRAQYEAGKFLDSILSDPTKTGDPGGSDITIEEETTVPTGDN